jgi:hypothetical protein
VRIKIALLAVLLFGCLLLTTCDLFPPELAMEFYLDSYAWDGGNDELTINYSMENIGSENLQNCKLYFEIDTNIGFYYRWTPGIDLDTSDGLVGDSYIYSLPGVGVINEVNLIGAGWDNPPDE